MTEAETRILKNQVEIMWVLQYVLSKVASDLVGKGGQLDRMRDDLAAAAMDSRAILDQQRGKDG